MHDRLITLNSFPRLLISLGSGSLVWGGFAALAGFLKQDFAGNILELSVLRSDLQIWELMITFIVIAGSIIIGEILGWTASVLRGRWVSEISDIALLEVLARTDSAAVHQFVERRQSVAHLAEMFGLSSAFFSITAFVGFYAHDGLQLSDIEFLSIAGTFVIIACGCIGFSFTLLRVAVETAKNNL